MDNLYQPVGSFLNDNTCRFTVWAPLQNSVNLVVSSPNQAQIPLTKDEAGYWTTTLQNVKPGLRYSYNINNELIRPDPASVSQPEGVHKPSEVIERKFDWTDDDWTGLALNDMIIYEIHTGTFTDKHSFEGIIDQLDYLKNLGINTLEIMPVAQFAGTHNWGYDGVYPFSVQHSYGGASGLKRLVNAAHQKGFAVLLDVVYNHLGPEGGYLADFGPYYTTRHKTPWGNAFNFDDAYCDGVRSFFLQNAMMWLDEFHMDGLRMDAVHAIVDYSAKHFMQVLKERTQELQKKSGKKKVLIAELDLNNPRYINPLEKKGYGLDGQWIDEFHHALHALLTGETNGYYEDFGSIHSLERTFRDTYVYNGVYSPHRKQIFGGQADENDYNQFVVFSQNHDHIGNRMLGDRLSTLLSFEQLKLAASVVLLSPYVPLLFMGEEWGEQAPFLYFTSHSDAELSKSVSEGRKKEFSHFQIEGEVPDPQAKETFQKSVLSWQWKEEKNTALFRFYQFLIQLRKTHVALQGKERSSLVVFPVGDTNVLCIKRTNEATSLLIVFNFNQEISEYTLPEDGCFLKIFDSSSELWMGNGEKTPKMIQSKMSFAMNPMSALIFEPHNNL